MIKPVLIFFFIIVSFNAFFCQSISDTIKNEKKTNLGTVGNSSSEKLPMQMLNPVQKKVIGATDLPLNLHVYSKAFANDFVSSPTFTPEELASGLSNEELSSFNSNKIRLQKVLTDYYGEDIINVEKILESLGLTKEQVVAMAALLKFVFAQGLLAAPL